LSKIKIFPLCLYQNPKNNEQSFNKNDKHFFSEINIGKRKLKNLGEWLDVCSMTETNKG
jgi:hypothetical protein